MDDREYLMELLENLYRLYNNALNSLRAEPNSQILQDLVLKYEHDIAEVENKLQF